MPIIGTLPFIFVNGEEADGTQVNANFEAVLNDVNVGAVSLFTATGTGVGVLQHSPTIDSADLTGNTTGVTQSPLTNNGTVATTEYVDAAVAAGGSSVTLTGDVTGTGTHTIATTIKANVNLSGNPTTTTQPPNTNNTTIATTAYVNNAATAGSYSGLTGVNNINQSISGGGLVPISFQSTFGYGTKITFNSGQPTKFTIASGVSVIRVIVNFVVEISGVFGSVFELAITGNGSPVYGQLTHQNENFQTYSFVSPPISVSTGDYLGLSLSYGAGTAQLVGSCFCEVQVLI